MALLLVVRDVKHVPLIEVSTGTEVGLCRMLSRR